MKNMFIAFFLVSSTLTANANTIARNVNSELAKVEREMDPCKVVISTNKLIKMGDAAVDSLSAALLNEKVANESKWSAAMALGHIRNARAISTLEQVLNTTSDSWLKSVSQDAISLIKGEYKGDDKVYVYAFAVKKLKVDCESKTSVIIK